MRWGNTVKVASTSSFLPPRHLPSPDSFVLPHFLQQLPVANLRHQLTPLLHTQPRFLESIGSVIATSFPTQKLEFHPRHEPSKKQRKKNAENFKKWAATVITALLAQFNGAAKNEDTQNLRALLSIIAGKTEEHFPGM